MSSKAREALKDAKRTLCRWQADLPVSAQVEVEDTLLKIKSALATERKYEAKWELGAEHEYAYCSHCGHQQWASWDSYREAYENIGEFHKEYKFCPNCGFEMKGATNEQ